MIQDAANSRSGKEVARDVNEVAEQLVTLDPREVLAFCGQNDQRIRELESSVDARIVVRGNEIRVIGAPGQVRLAHELINDLLDAQRRSGAPVPREQFRTALRFARDATQAARDVQLSESAREERNGSGTIRDAMSDENSPSPRRGDSQSPSYAAAAARPRLRELVDLAIHVPLKRRTVAPLTPGQKRYVEAIRRRDIVFGIGPAGTGKTYLAMAMAVASLTSGAVSRIILVRPAVEAGERLGFLPGDIAQKFDPYVRPLYDALYEMMDADQIKHAIETGVIEVAPLAFMRGRTLNRSFVILDEAQNTTVEQMKMFLTRFGFESKAVITGDITQIDLPRGSRSGLVHVQSVLAGIEGIEFILFQEEDVVRHDLVQKIIRAYEQMALQEAAAAAAEARLKANAAARPGAPETPSTPVPAAAESNSPPIRKQEPESNGR